MQYKVECFDDNCWQHRVWKKSEIAADAMAAVESKSRHKAYRVMFQSKIIYQYDSKGNPIPF